MDGQEMLKGINRNMIVVRTPPTSKFEVAYFVLRRDGGTDSHRKILSEASEMIASGEGNVPQKRRGFLCTLCFVLGILAGAGGAWIVYAMFL